MAELAPDHLAGDLAPARIRAAPASSGCPRPPHASSGGRQPTSSDASSPSSFRYPKLQPQLLIAMGQASKELESYKKGDRVRYIGSLQPTNIILDGHRYEQTSHEFGSLGQICLHFEENRSSKVGVRFDEQIPGGIDLGGSCEVDHGLFCSVDSLCLDSPGWENRSKHPFDVIIQFISEEIQHGPMVLLLKDTAKICRNNDSYYGLKSKLEQFPAGVYIVGSHIQPDSRKEKGNAGSLFLSKFPYSQAILDLALQLLTVLLPIVGLGALIFFAQRNILQSDCPNCGKSFRILKTSLKNGPQFCPYCTQPFSVLLDWTSLKYANQSFFTAAMDRDILQPHPAAIFTAQ